MAKQIGTFKAKGRIGDFSFYKSKEGAMVRLKGGVDAKRIKNDPAFARTRENGKEFGRAAKRGQLLRASLRSAISNSSDSRVCSRLLKAMLGVLKSDTISPRGERDVLHGDLTSLHGFEFNPVASLSSNLFIEPSLSLDRGTGEVTINLPDFNPIEAISIAAGASHFRFILGASDIDWNGSSYVSDIANENWIMLNAGAEAARSVVLNLPANTLGSIILVFGVEYGQEVNGQTYLLSNGAYNSLSIVMADKV